MDVHYSSKTDLWETPADLYRSIEAVYHPTLDVCATPDNAKCARYFTKDEDGLTQDWRGVCWMNPPYGREIGKWVRKAATCGATVIALLPARTDTAWWHDYVMGNEITFIRGRLKFGGGKNSAPFPSAIVVFGAKEITHERE